MTEITIKCPNCRSDLKLTESLAAPLLETTRQKYEDIIAQKDLEVSQKEADVVAQKEKLQKEKLSLEKELQLRLSSEVERVKKDELQKARQAVAYDLEAKAEQLIVLKEQLEKNNQKLSEAQKVQAEFYRKERELEDAKREMNIVIEKKVSESLLDVREKAKREVEESLKQKVSEKEQQIFSMQRQIEDLKRKAEQGSQQLQGEVQELELESLLKIKFPHDIIEPVPKGEAGGDIIQKVIGPLNRGCGIILWESKRTKNWNDNWLSKLRDDQRSAKADIALLITKVLPRDVTAFDFIDGIWVAQPNYILPLAIALRQSLIQIANARIALDGQQSKMALVYEYLTGPQFRQRIEAIVEKFTDMQEDLDKERKAIMRGWAKRELQIKGVLETTVGMYGDLQGIAGKAIQEIEALSFPLLESDTEEGQSPH
ncbi:MAG: DUF2130 domain-containing protein [Hyphomicrobium sp.]